MSEPTRPQPISIIAYNTRADQRTSRDYEYYPRGKADAYMNQLEAENQRLREQLKKCNESHVHPRIIEDRSGDIAFNDEWEGENG